MAHEIEIEQRQAEDLALKACLGAGADAATARALVDATLSAARFGPPTLGFPHMLDYLHSFRDGRINCAPAPSLTRPFEAMVVSDADGGIAQLGFDLAFDTVVEATRRLGIVMFTQTNSYTAGELGYYVRRLAAEGIVGLAATNANAVVVSKPGGPPVYGTNPMAFGFPLGEGAYPMVIDQASSATAFVNIVAAAADEKPIPKGWAVDENGVDTEDPRRALGGALLPFGGRKGANIALLVEMMSAGLSGGAWSLDTPDFRSGNVRSAVGLTVLAMMPGAEEEGRIARARAQVDRLSELDVYIPGFTDKERRPSIEGMLRMPVHVHEKLGFFAGITRQ